MWKQSVHHDRANVDDNKLKEFDSDFEKTLEDHGKVDDIEWRLSLSNHDGNDNSDSDLNFVFSLISQDE